ARLDLVLLAGFAIDDRTLALVAEHGLQMVLVPHVAFQAGRKRRLVKRITHAILGQQPAHAGPAIRADDFTIGAAQLFGANYLHLGVSCESVFIQVGPDYGPAV